LIEQFKQRWCPPSQGGDGYSSRLLHCSCGKHAAAAVVCGDDAAEPVKLFGAALSWFLSTGLSGPPTYVVGKDDAGKDARWLKAVHAIQTLQSKDLDVCLEVDFEPAPALGNGDLTREDWVDAMLDRHRRTLPHAAKKVAAELAGVPSFRWYRSVTGYEWSGRIEGLQVCTFAGQRFVFAVGGPGGEKNSGPRNKFLEIMRGNPAELGQLDGNERLVIGEEDPLKAAEVIRRLMSLGIGACGSPEHRFESQVLAGSVKLKVGGEPLEPVVEEDGAPFQFPALWWPGGRPRYVDVMARQGNVPWIVELKVELGRGEYYRDGIVQAALYREYVVRSSGLDRWFKEHGELQREECRAALVVPPLEGEVGKQLLNDHLRVAARLGVELIQEPKAADFRRKPTGVPRAMSRRRGATS
jgi:hypothetical protein